MNTHEENGYLDAYQQKEAFDLRKTLKGAMADAMKDQKAQAGGHGISFRTPSRQYVDLDPQREGSLIHRALKDDKDLGFLTKKYDSDGGGLAMKWYNYVTPVLDSIPGVGDEPGQTSGWDAGWLGKKLGLANNTIPFTKQRAEAEIADEIKSGIANQDYSAWKKYYSSLPLARDISKGEINRAVNAKIHGAIPGLAAAAAVGIPAAIAMLAGGLGGSSKQSTQQQLSPQQQAFFTELDKLRQQRQPEAFRLDPRQRAASQSQPRPIWPR